VLNSIYEPTDPRNDIESAVATCSQTPTFSLVVGAYSDGMLMVVDKQSGNTLLRNWTWLVGESSIALLTTGFGDIFFWDPSNGVSYLEVQRAEIEFVDANIGWFLDEFLVHPRVVEKVLRKERFCELSRLKRSLRYHEVFLLQPWLMLGGQDKLENYNIGECNVYLDLVGQSHHRTD